MRVLAVDTALGACSAAVVDDDEILAHSFEPMERGHAERIAPMVRQIMDIAGLGYGDLDRLGVTVGPGTFTGQRVGIAFMRGLRVALKTPLIGITTLEAMMAEGLNESGLEVAAALHDAKRGEVYCAAGVPGGLAVPISLARDVDAVALIRSALGGRTVALVGSAGEAAARALCAQGSSARFIKVLQPDALWVARLSLVAPAPDGPPKPLYLRPPDARLPGGSRR